MIHRKKVADALVNGKVIRIRMGEAQIGVRKKNLTRETFEQEISRFHQRNKKVARDYKKIGDVVRKKRNTTMEAKEIVDEKDPEFVNSI